jgi:hypothetical protein
MRTSVKGDPGPQIREPYGFAAATTLIALWAAVYSAGQNSPMAQPQIDQPAPIGPPQYATVTVFDSRAVQGILGKEVRSAHDENMGRVVTTEGVSRPLTDRVLMPASERRRVECRLYAVAETPG